MTTQTRALWCWVALVGTLGLPGRAAARNVDLSTVPRRGTVSLTIYNSEDLTLVRETRRVSFKKGVNPLQFSWANTLIDPTSVELKFPGQADKLEVLDTTFPHDKPQMLYWNVQSEIEGEAGIEITYFTSGISWSADYVAIADRDEKQMGIEGFVRVFNNSGEEYDNAQVKLVVGTVNLVEKIRQLASVADGGTILLGGQTLDGVKRDWAKKLVKLKDGAEDLSDLSFSLTGGTVPAKIKEVIKESLSEYFIYTIEGTETIQNGWSKRMRSFDAAGAPFQIQYRYRPAEYGDQLVRMYLLSNNAQAKLGTTPLPNGVVRVFRDNGRQGLSFLGEQTIKYVPIGDKIELNLGPDRNVIFELVQLKSWRDEIWMQLRGANVFRRVDQPGVRMEANSTVAGWDEHALFAQRIRNYSGKPIELEIRRGFGGHAIFISRLNPVLHDYQTVQFGGAVKAGEKLDLLFELITRQGRNARQNNVTLQAGDVKN